MFSPRNATTLFLCAPLTVLAQCLQRLGSQSTKRSLSPRHPDPRKKARQGRRSDAFHLYESRTYHARPDIEPLRAGGPGRAQVPDPKESNPNHVVRRALQDLANDGPPHSRALMSCGKAGKNPYLWFGYIEHGRNNKNQSPGWLVSLVIGDYLARFGEHL